MLVNAVVVSRGSWVTVGADGRHLCLQLQSADGVIYIYVRHTSLFLNDESNGSHVSIIRSVGWANLGKDLRSKSLVGVLKKINTKVSV